MRVSEPGASRREARKRGVDLRNRNIELQNKRRIHRVLTGGAEMHVSGCGGVALAHLRNQALDERNCQRARESRVLCDVVGPKAHLGRRLRDDFRRAVWNHAFARLRPRERRLKGEDARDQCALAHRLGNRRARRKTVGQRQRQWRRSPREGLCGTCIWVNASRRAGGTTPATRRLAPA